MTAFPQKPETNDAVKAFHKGQRVERVSNGQLGTIVMMGGKVLAIRWDGSDETLPIRPDAVRAA
jgi:hypothetical protein